MESFSNDSWITHVQYDFESQRMEVTTKSDSYELQGVPQDVFDEFKKSSSKGAYFNKYLKGQYNHKYFD